MKTVALVFNDKTTLIGFNKAARFSGSLAKRENHLGTQGDNVNFLGAFPKRVLILGASGFIGRYLSVRLRSEKTFWVYEHQGRRECDLTCTNDVNALFRLVDPDVIFHLAALPDYLEQDVITNNVAITKNILSTLPVDHPVTLIHVGSYKQYGYAQLPFVENMPLRPYNAYSKSKTISEDLIRCYGETHNQVKTILLRLGPVIGMLQPQQTFIPTVIRSIVSRPSNKLKIADVIWDPTPVEDVVDALVATTHNQLTTNVTINISYAIARSSVAIARSIADFMGCTIDPIIVRDNSAFSSLGNCELAKQVLHWQAHRDINEAIKNIIEYNTNFK